MCSTGDPGCVGGIQGKVNHCWGNGPLARKLKYVRNVGDVTPGGTSATILCTEKIRETGVLFVGCSHVPESCSLPRACEQGVKAYAWQQQSKRANRP